MTKNTANLMGSNRLCNSSFAGCLYLQPAPTAFSCRIWESTITEGVLLKLSS